MAMKLKNLTPFPFGTKVTSRRPPRPEMTLVLRAAYVLSPGKPLSLPEGPPLVAQGPLRAETYREEDEERTGECLYPGDFADWKPRAEVMLKGTCHTPFGKPLPECPVRFVVGSFEKLLRIVGRRFWSDDQPGAVMSQPAPFTKMPVDYAHAFGGPGYAANPSGLGLATRELPNVEHARAAIRARRDDPGVAGFGALSPSWPLRAAKVGKEWGPKWKKERAPYYAEDFDWTHFNAAPLDQQLPGFLRGDENVLFQNLHPTEQVFETRLPAIRIRAFVNDVKRRFREVAMSLDTLFADLDEGRLYLTWRGLDPVEADDLTDVETIVVASEPLADERLPASHYRAILDKFEADPLEIDSHVPAGMLAQLEEMKARQKAREEGRPVVAHAAPPADPLSAMVRTTFDAAPVASPNAKDVEKQVADAVARAIAKSPPGVDTKGNIARAANDASAQALKPAAFPLRPGGPAPAWAAKALEQALSQGEKMKALAASGKLPREQAEEARKLEAQMEAIKAEPFFKKILDRPAYVAPGPRKDLTGQDYQDSDLSGMDLRGAILRDANLAGASLRGTKLAGVNLDGAVLSGADLTGADFTGADLTVANLTGVIAEQAIFRDTVIDRAFFQKANLRGAVFGGAKGEASFFPDADLRGADLQGISLVRAFFKGADLSGADLSGASLSRCLFIEASARRARLRKAFLSFTSFGKSDLSGADLREARGDGSIWIFAILHDADFGQAILPRAELMEASADRASFRRSILKEARCYRASFEHADFSESQLMSVDFSKCSLSGAKFTGACLFDAKLKQASGKGCDFTGANLARAVLETT